MKHRDLRNLMMSIFASALVLVSFGVANAQIQSAGGGYYVAGDGNVYGSYGQASAAQSRMYDQMKQQNRKTSERNALELAGVLIKLVLKTDPENLRLENGRIMRRLPVGSGTHIQSYREMNRET